MQELRLSPDQWVDAIANTDGPQLVVSGPGAGKTEFLVRRAVHLIQSGVEPEKILVLTFSRRGASELRNRILDAAGRSVQAISSSTFHSFARRLLETFGPNPVPELLTGPEQVALVADLLADDDPRKWPIRLQGLLRSPTLVSDTADFLLRCAERSIDPDHLERLAEDHEDWRALPDLFRRYLRLLKELNRTDYGTLLAEAVALLRQTETAKSVSEQFRYVLVDEYQDTSPAQAELLLHLSATNRNITAAGDPYQSVYSFRGADLRNIDRFGERFGDDSLRIVLTTSFRVPRQILDAALAITSGADLPGAAGPMIPAPHRGVVEAFVFDQESAEAEWIAEQVERMHLIDRMPYRQMAVALRSKRHLLAELSRALERRRIPHDTPDTRLVDHPAVQIIFDLAKAAAWNDRAPTEEHDQAIRRVLLGPLLRIPVGKERTLVRRRRIEGLSWSATIRSELPEHTAIADLLENSTWATDEPAAVGFWHVWHHLPHLAGIVSDPSAVDFRRAWTSFSQALQRQTERDPSVSLLRFWEVSSSESFEANPLLGLRDDGSDRLILTTLHQAKGLEFEVLFIADATDNLFPDLRRGISLLDPHRLAPEIGDDHLSYLRFRLQEETRLAYTAMTRARRRVVWTATAAGIDEGERRPSRFLTAVASLADQVSVTSPPPDPGPPVTPRQFESQLRRVLANLSANPAERLAAAAVLSEAPDGHWDASRFAGLRRPGPDTGVMPDHFTLSPSQVERYIECPRRYVFERRLSVAQPVTTYLTFGSLIHDVLETVERRSIERGESPAPLEEVLAALDQAWTEVDFGSEALNAVWRLKAEQCLTRLISEWPADAHKPVTVEHGLSMELGGVTWRGIADRIDSPNEGELRVIDYKTSVSIPSKEDAASSLQLAYYLLAAGVDSDLMAVGTPTSAELWYPRTTLKGFRRSFDINRLDEVREEMEAASRAIAAEDWTPRINSRCRTCHVKTVCPEWPEGREAFIS